MANLKYGETHITNITQLCGSGTWSLPQPEVVDTTQDCIICIDNDLDFNDEDFYYHNDNFLNIALPNGKAKSVTFDGQNHTLTNMYMLPQKSFFYVTDGYDSGYIDFVIKNTTFEIVLNSFAKMMTLLSHRSNLTFRNCIFNIKSISSLNSIFYKNKDRNSDWGTNSFVNCIFNIECNCLSNFNVLYAGTDRGVIGNIESCEFRIKIIHATPNHTITLVYNTITDIFKNDNFSNSLVFVNNYSNELVTIKLVYDNNTNASSSYIKSFTNNFISAFDGVSADANKVSLDIEVAKGSLTTLSSSFFIDTDCVSISSHLQELADTTYPGMINLIPLTTAESKSPTEMAAKGYVFAQE